MVNEDENLEGEDKVKREAIYTRIRADSMVYQTEKWKKEMEEM